MDIRLQSSHVTKAIWLLGEIGSPARVAMPNVKHWEREGHSQIRDLATAALKKIQTAAQEHP